MSKALRKYVHAEDGALCMNDEIHILNNTLNDSNF